MAGPVTMALGPFMFRAHGFGYSDLGRKLNTSWAQLETAGRFHALQWTGPSEDVVAVNGVLFPREFGGQSTLEGVRLAAQRGIPLPLFTLGGRYFGLQAIHKVDEDRTFVTRTGTPGQNAYSLEMKKLSGGFSLLSLLGVI
jgi:phage protein U